MTRTNEIVGTPAYLAPEQVLGEDVGPPADVYSLGLTLLECLTGVTEYRGVSEVATAVARLHRPPRLPDDLPAWLASLLGAMTGKDHASRPTAAECAREFGRPHDPTVVVPLRPSRRSRMVRPMVAAAAGIAALTVGLVLTQTGSSAAARPQVAPVADNQQVVVPSTTQNAAPTTTDAPAPKPATPAATVPDHPAVVAVVRPSTHQPGAGKKTNPQPHFGLPHFGLLPLGPMLIGPLHPGMDHSGKGPGGPDDHGPQGQQHGTPGGP